MTVRGQSSIVNIFLLIKYTAISLSRQAKRTQRSFSMQEKITQASHYEFAQNLLEILVFVHEYLVDNMRASMSPNHYRALLMLKHFGPDNMGSLAKKIAVSKQQMTPIIGCGPYRRNRARACRGEQSPNTPASPRQAGGRTRTFRRFRTCGRRRKART